MKKTGLGIVFTLGLSFFLQAQDTISLPAQGSGGLYNTCYAAIFDNGLDNNYLNNSNAYITIAPLWVETVSVYFEIFETEVFFDRVNLYDGPGTSFPLIITASGTELQGQTVASTGNALTIQLVSDDIETGAGFKAWVSCLMNTENETTAPLIIFPNPGTDDIYIQGLTGEETMMVTQVSGKTMYGGHALPTLHTTTWTPGIYFLHITDANGHGRVFKWIKA